MGLTNSDNDFNFMDDDMMDKTDEAVLDETATSGNPERIHQGLTREQVEYAQMMAGSSKGLNIAEFQKMTGVFDINIDDLIRFRLPKETQED